MSRMSIPLVAVILVLLLPVGIVTVALAQGSGSSRATPTPPKQPTVDEFATSLWQFMTREKAPYQKWPSTPAAPIEGVESPHGTAGKTYFNEAAATGWKQPPQGAILVHEELDEDGKKIKAVSVMYRVKGTAPKTNDWYWLRYQPNGKLAMQDKKPVAGQVTSCIECHRKAAGNDFIFSNEAAPKAETQK
jgi:hypothetical protein